MPWRKRGGRRRAAGAGALHVQIDDAVLEALERDVAAVVGDRRPHARLDQLLDGGDGLGVGGVEKFVASSLSALAPVSSGAPDMKCSMIAPRIIGLSCCHSAASSLVTAMKSEPKNTPLTPSIANSRSASGDCAASSRLAQVERAGVQHGPAGQEFQGRRVGRRFGLDEHRWLPSACAAARCAVRHKTAP